ncbi:hypothetical protein [Georgenia sp. H159]|uniref:hypothetical protein n=1 Tax=Georgenia sp. H159 TaxID=3076115 RepID=UPI002D77B3D7|nr:hypothetical protein [Georgenia sp. H159]
MTTPNPLSDMFRTVLRRMTVLLAALAVGGCVVGYLAAGMPGLWGGALGAGIVAFFMLTTAAVMLATADKPLQTASASFVGSWLVKILVVFVVLVLVRDRDFYHPLVFFVTLTLGILGSVTIEMVGALKARVPYVDPGARRDDRQSGG